MLPYLMICVSVVFEVFADTMMKVSDGFRRKLPIVGVVVGYAVSFWMMSHVLLQLPLGPVYAAWTGLGIALTAVVGHILWNEGFNAKKIIGLVAIIVGVALLKLGGLSMSVAEEEKQLVREKAKSKRFAFVLLGIAIVAEVTGAICLKASRGLDRSVAYLGYGDRVPHRVFFVGKNPAEPSTWPGIRYLGRRGFRCNYVGWRGGLA